MTEVVFALGLGDRLAARSDFCDWPPECETRPALGNQQTLSLERAADFRPDLVIWWAHLPDQVKLLRETFRLTVVTPGTENRTETLDGIRTVARACGVPGRGDALVSHIQTGLDDARRHFAGAGAVRALVVLDHSDVLYVPGRTSFLQDLFDIVGATNVAAGLEGGTWPTVGFERVLEWDPDVIVDLSIGDGAGNAVKQAAAFWERHPEVRAVRSSAVHFVSAGVLVRPGPRLPAVAEAFGRIVHHAH